MIALGRRAKKLPKRLAERPSPVGDRACAWECLRTVEKSCSSACRRGWGRGSAWDSGGAENASTAEDDCSVPLAGVGGGLLAAPYSADADVAAAVLLVVHGVLHAVSVPTAVSGSCPPWSAAYLALPAGAGAASPHSARRKWQRFASETVPVRSAGLAVTSFGSRP